MQQIHDKYTKLVRLFAQGTIGYSSVSREGSSLSVPFSYVSLSMLCVILFCFSMWSLEYHFKTSVLIKFQTLNRFKITPFFYYFLLLYNNRKMVCFLIYLIDNNKAYRVFQNYTQNTWRIWIVILSFYYS